MRTTLTPWMNCVPEHVSAWEILVLAGTAGGMAPAAAIAPPSSTRISARLIRVGNTVQPGIYCNYRYCTNEVEGGSVQAFRLSASGHVRHAYPRLNRVINALHPTRDPGTAWRCHSFLHIILFLILCALYAIPYLFPSNTRHRLK